MQNKPSFTWVIVADKSQAKFYRIVKFPKLEEVAHFEHPESRLRNSELVSTKPGRSFQRGGPTRHSYQQETEPKHLEAVKFAQDLAEHLAHFEQKGEFKEIYLFAEPSFLGLLRQNFSHELRKMIVAEVPKQLTNHNPSEIESYLRELNP